MSETPGKIARKAPVMIDTDEYHDLTDDEKVSSWRFACLSDLYPPDLAEEIANSNADLHLAIELIEQGCKPELAAKILL